VSPARPHPGGIHAGRGTRRDQPSSSFRRRGGFGRHGSGVIVYPYVYYGYPYGYGNGGYAIETGAVSRTSSSASYVIDGHLDTSSERVPHSRVYEVGPGAADAPDAQEAGSLDSGEAEGEPAGPQGNVFYLIALKGGLIYASNEHWLLGNTVHFVTLQGDHYVVSLEEMDLDLSVQLNRERGLKFALEVREQGAGAPAEPDAIP
jgi:hypothetical protein